MPVVKSMTWLKHMAKTHGCLIVLIAKKTDFKLTGSCVNSYVSLDLLGVLRVPCICLVSVEADGVDFKRLLLPAMIKSLSANWRSKRYDFADGTHGRFAEHARESHTTANPSMLLAHKH